MGRGFGFLPASSIVPAIPMILVLLAALGRAGAAALLLAALSLIGFALLPEAARPRRARLLLPLSLSAGALAVGWCSWVAGSLLGTRAVPVVFLLLAAISIPRARPFARTLGRALRELWLRTRAAPGAALLVLIPAAISIPALVAPLSDSDGIRYHAALPKLFLITGKVFLYPWDVTGALPESVEMLNMLLLPWTGGEGAKLLHFAFFVATLPVIALLVPVRATGRSAAALAAFFFAASPVALVPASAAFVDHAGLFHVATALLLAVHGAPVLAVGIALAAAAFTKITLLPVAVIALVPILRTRPRWRPLLAALLPAAVALAPLAIRNEIATGDPFYPAGYALLGRPIPGADEARRAVVFAAERAAPIRFVRGEGRADDALGLHHLLGLAALFLVARERRFRPLLLVALVFLGAAPVFHLPARFLLPAVAVLAAVEGIVLARALRRTAVPVALLLAAPGLSTSAMLLLGGPAPAFAAGRIDRSAYLAATVPGWRAARLVNGLPSGGTVMALDFPGPYFFERPWIAEGIMNDPPLKRWLQAGDGAEAILSRLRALDVRYLVVTPGYGGGTNASLLPLAFSAQSARALLDLRSRLRLVGRVDGVDVWAVPPAVGNAPSALYDPGRVEGGIRSRRGGSS